MNGELNKVHPRQQNPFRQKVFTLVVYYLAVASFFPPIKAFRYYNLSCFIAMFACGIYILMLYPVPFKKEEIHKHMILFFIIYTFWIPYIFGNVIIGHRYMLNGEVIFFYLIYQYNHSYGYDNSSKLIIKLSLPFIVYASIKTLFRLISEPYLSRSIKSHGEYSTMVSLQGVGGYDLIYFLVFIIIFLLFVLLNNGNFKISIWSQVGINLLLFLFITTVIYSNYFTALVIIVVSFFTLVILKKRSIFRKTLLTIVGIFTLSQGKWIFTNITNFLISVLGRGRTAERLISLQVNIFGSGGGENLLQDRTGTLNSSWNALLQNPVSGLVTNKILYQGDYLVGFGQHSQVLDTFALYGVFIGLLYIYILMQPFIRRMGRNSTLSSLNFAILASTLIVFVMNNNTLSIGYGVFFIYPVLYDYLFERLKLNVDQAEKTSENYIC